MTIITSAPELAAASDLVGNGSAKKSPAGIWPLVTQYDWGLLGARITLSAALYPVVISGTFAVIASAAMILRVIAGSLDQADSPLQLLAIFPGMLVGSIMSMLGGGMWGGIVTVVVLPIVYLVAWSLQLRMSFIRLGAFSGGLVGFIAVLPIVGLTIPGLGNGADLPTVLIMLAVGPALTTIVGQLGGAWGGYGGLQNYRLELLNRGAPDEVIIDLASEHPPRFQFQIRHMLWATVWVSVLLGAIRLLGLPFAAVLPLFCGWLVFQWATLVLGARILRRLVPWWIARRSQRST